MRGMGGGSGGGWVVVVLLVEVVLVSGGGMGSRSVGGRGLPRLWPFTIPENVYLDLGAQFHSTIDRSPANAFEIVVDN